MKLDSSISLGRGKIFSGYLFLGGCISITLLGIVQGIYKLKPNELVFFIVSTGGLLGSIISTTNLHKIWLSVLPTFFTASLRK